MDDFQILRTRLKESREKAGMTQKQLADKIGVSTQTISTYEREKIPTLENLVAIAETLNVSVDWLLGKEQEKPQSKPENLADIFLMIETLEEYLMQSVEIKRNEEEIYDIDCARDSYTKVTYDMIFHNCPEELCSAFKNREIAKHYDGDIQTVFKLAKVIRDGTIQDLKKYKVTGLPF